MHCASTMYIYTTIRLRFNPYAGVHAHVFSTVGLEHFITINFTVREQLKDEQQTKLGGA